MIEKNPPSLILYFHNVYLPPLLIIVLPRLADSRRYAAMDYIDRLTELRIDRDVKQTKLPNCSDASSPLSPNTKPEKCPIIPRTLQSSAGFTTSRRIMCWGCRRECRTPSAPEPKPVYLTVCRLFLWAGFPAAGGGRLAGAGAEEAAEGIDAGKAQTVGHGGHRLVRGR